MKESKNLKDLKERVNYQKKYIDNYEEFAKKILNKTVLPIQLEIQPGREKGKEICWMKCPYCYGGKAKNTGQRLSLAKYLKILNETAKGPYGNILKIIFAGYATDPLNYEHIAKLVSTSINNKQIVGIHTKLLKISSELMEVLSSDKIVDKSYVTVSLDSGFSKSYNLTHGIKTTKDVLARVYTNIEKLSKIKPRNLNIGSTYLVTKVNFSKDEIIESIKKVNDLGIDTHRFSFPQVPRNYSLEGEQDIIIRDKKNMITEINNIISSFSSGYKTIVSMVDPDTDYKIDAERYLPCFARFVHPCIGFDGHLYHCSESSSPDFHSLSLGNLSEKSFWESYYDYDLNDLKDSFKKMKQTGCICDRKLFIVNKQFYETKAANLFKRYINEML